MRLKHLVAAAALAVTGATATPARADVKHDKTSEGALKERKDPKKDLHLQKENAAKLHINAVEDRKAGNRVAAWAAESDAKHAKKLVDKDEKILKQSGGQATTKTTTTK